MKLQVQQPELTLGVAEATIRIPEIVVYEHIDYGGIEFRTNLNIIYIGDRLNDKVSSFIVVSGKWQFYKDKDFKQPLGRVFGPGYYRWVEDVGIPNDEISSFKCVAF